MASKHLPRSPDPVAAEHLATWENLKGQKEMPRRWAEFLASRRLDLHVPKGMRGDPYARISGKSDSGQLRWALREGVTLGLPGRTREQVDPRKLRRSKVQQWPAHVPDWVSRHFHPTLSAPPRWATGPSVQGNKRGELFWGVYPPEDRQVYYPTGYPWQCIGRIFAWNDVGSGSWTWWGSGVLIGPRHVLTAGHVVPWDGPAWGMQFVPAYYDGGSLLGPGASSWVSDARGWRTSFDSRLPNGQDLAMLRLYEPLGEALGYFGSKTYVRQWDNLPEFYLTGYPAAIAGAERPSYERRIPILRDDEQDGGFAELNHHGDSTGGDSGGPFWSFWPDCFPYAVGTVSGGYVTTDGSGKVIDDFNVAAGGSAMGNLISQARTEWP